MTTHSSGSLTTDTMAPPGGGKPSGRLLELDVLRALAAIAVVTIHVTAPVLAAAQVNVGGQPQLQTSRAFWAAAGLNQWARFSIPAFVLISGLALFYSYGHRQVRTGEFLRRRLATVGVPYLFWSVFYMALTTWAGGQAWGGFGSRLGLALVQGTAMYQLYFVVLILQFYLLFPLIKPLARSPLLPYLTGAAVLVQYWLMVKAGSPHGWGPQPPLVQGLLRWQDRLFPWWLGYFAVGAWLGVNLEVARTWWRRYWLGLLGLSAALFAVLVWEFARRLAGPGVNVGWAASGFRPTAYLYSLVSSAAYMALGLWLTARRAGVFLSRQLLELARTSFGIYLVHPLVLLGWQMALRHLALPLGPTLLLGVTLVVVLAGSYLLTRLVGLLPRADLIIGK